MTAKLLGIAAIVLGALALAYGGFTYAYPDNVANVGPVHLTVQRRASVFVPPVLGVVVLAGGAALLFASSRKA